MFYLIYHPVRVFCKLIRPLSGSFCKLFRPISGSLSFDPPNIWVFFVCPRLFALVCTVYRFPAFLELPIVFIMSFSVFWIKGTSLFMQLYTMYNHITVIWVSIDCSAHFSGSLNKVGIRSNYFPPAAKNTI